MDKSLKSATAYVLIGMTTAWIGFLLATYWMFTDLKRYLGSFSDDGGSLTRPATYVFLAALLGQAFFVALAYRISDVELAKKTPGALPILKYATVWIVVTALALFFFAFSAFSTSLPVEAGFIDLFTAAYLPIILAALGCVTLLLSTTVYRKSEMGQGERTEEVKTAKREAALAFIFPVLGGALVFLIISTGVHNGAGNNVWFWILNVLLVAAFLGLGGFYSARTKGFGYGQADTKGAKGTTALRLNLTLVVIFIVILTVGSFGSGTGVVVVFAGGDIEVNDWLVNQMLPVLAVYVISVVITYFTVRVRSIISAK